jgi:hypothetical protein
MNKKNKNAVKVHIEGHHSNDLITYGESFKLDTLPEYEFIIHRSILGVENDKLIISEKRFSMTEKTTGCAVISERKSKIDTIIALRELLEKIGTENFKLRIDSFNDIKTDKNLKFLVWQALDNIGFVALDSEVSQFIEFLNNKNVTLKLEENEG